MQPPIEKSDYATERLYLQKGEEIVVCVFNLRPPVLGQKREPAYCARGLYEGK